MNGLADVARMLQTGADEALVDPALSLRAKLPIDCMPVFNAALKQGSMPKRACNAFCVAM